MSSFAALLTVKSVNLVVALDGFLCKMESLIVCIFYRGYFDNREKFLICTAG